MARTPIRIVFLESPAHCDQILDPTLQAGQGVGIRGDSPLMEATIELAGAGSTSAVRGLWITRRPARTGLGPRENAGLPGAKVSSIG